VAPGGAGPAAAPAGPTCAKPNDPAMNGCSSATATLPGTRAGSAPGGGAGSPTIRYSKPDCCWASPVHSTACTGSDTVGNPTSTTRSRPPAHRPFSAGSPRAVAASSPSINSTRVCATGRSAGPGAGGWVSAGGGPGGPSSKKPRMNARRSSAAPHASASSASTSAGRAARLTRATPAAGNWRPGRPRRARGRLAYQAAPPAVFKTARPRTSPSTRFTSSAGVSVMSTSSATARISAVSTPK
jgi:hypothetical protein